MLKIKIARDFALVPGARWEWQGKSSAEEFLKTLLRPKFLEARDARIVLQIDFDGAEGYSTAFLDGSFGELGREFGSDAVLAVLTFVSLDEVSLIDEVTKHIKSGKK